MTFLWNTVHTFLINTFTHFLQAILFVYVKERLVGTRVGSNKNY